MLDCQKHLFSLPQGLHYLNCAYMSPILKTVEAAGIAGVRRKAVPSEIRPEDFFRDNDRVRSLFARLVGVPESSRIAIVPGVSYGLAVVARNTPVHRGQNIVIAHEQFPSNVYVWQRVCRENGLDLRTVKPPGADLGRGSGWNERILEAIDHSTAIVALEQVQWTDGTLFHLDEIGRRARACGSALIVDGTQSIGAMPFHVPTLQPDALVCAGYKWLMGPYSIGVAYYGPRYEQGRPLEETWIGRQGSEDFRALVDYQDHYQGGAIRYDVCERSNFILVPMMAEALEQVLEWGPGNVQEYCRHLVRGLLERVCDMGFIAEPEAWRGSHLFGLRSPFPLEPAIVGPLLQRRQVSISLRGSALRISPHVYNDVDDISALEQVLVDLASGHQIRS